MMPMTAKSYFYEGVLLKVILGRDPKIMFTGEVKHGRPGEIQIDLHRVSFDLASLLEKKVVRANEGPEEFVVKTHDDLVVMHGKGNVVAIRLDDVHETLKSVRATVKLAYY
ncbi:MAG: hypothetical protein GTN93_33130 [Anaerolineae bacterium]|nr:hypothetical protein [Anaerolineae bacterium]